MVGRENCQVLPSNGPSEPREKMPEADSDVSRCPRCYDLVQSVLDSLAPSLQPGLETLRISYGLCRHCDHHIYNNEIDSIGKHLVAYHDRVLTDTDSDIPRACDLCLLVLQARCKNGTLHTSSSATPPRGSEMLSRTSSLRGVPQLYSDSGEVLSLAERLAADTARFTISWQSKMRVIPLRQIDWAPVREWLHQCESQHKPCCNQQLINASRPRMSSRIFIDVRNRCLVAGSADYRYVALSYVWGGHPPLRLTKANRSSLFERDAFRSLGTSLPAVIGDSMSVVESIGETYLWVDALCIVQDDEVAKHHLLQDMARIYDGAFVTIVAVAGQHADCGLPGVRPGTRQPCSPVEICGTDIHIAAREQLQSVLDASVYVTRGWTFQERLFSRRCLYFANSQLFFQCQQHRWSEHSLKNSKTGATWADCHITKGHLALLGRPPNEAEIEVGGRVLKYMHIVNEYSCKSLTFPEDILRAFAGISTVVEQLSGWTMAYGIPMEILDYALLWEPLDSQTWLRAAAADLIPTWSWAAWEGEIGYSEWTASELLVFHSPIHMESGPRLPSSLLEASEITSQPRVLVFETEYLPMAAFSTVDAAWQNGAHGSMLSNKDGKHVGTIHGRAWQMPKDEPHTHGQGETELVLLSASKLSVHRFSMSFDVGAPSPFDCGYPRDSWSILTVMIVQWKGGYAYRQALGYIHRDAWKEAGPKTKEFRLA